MSTLLGYPLSVGSVLSFSYPLDNRLKVFTRLRRRRFVVESIRDIALEPIEPWAIALRPDLRRGPVLITGHDLDLHLTRSFYVSSARSIRSLSMPISRLALFDPCDDSLPLKFVGPLWTDSNQDVGYIREIIGKYNERAAARAQSKLALGLFPYFQHAPLLSRAG